MAAVVCVDAAAPAQAILALNAKDYLEMPGLNVILGYDTFEEHHQGGVIVIQNGYRVASNGDLRLEPTPGQWQLTPAVVGQREVDRASQEMRMRMKYPDASKDEKGFNPVQYPDLRLDYIVRVVAAGQAFRILVDLDKPLPEPWVGKVGFNLEFFPEKLFGKTFQFERSFGIFPRQANGPGLVVDGDYEVAPLGQGKRLTIAPESESQRFTIEVVRGGELTLLDGRAQHYDGTFVVRALVPAGAAKGAIEWLVTPYAVPDWTSPPVIQVSQVGYHPDQAKLAVIELDCNSWARAKEVQLITQKSADAGLLASQEVVVGVEARPAGDKQVSLYRVTDSGPQAVFTRAAQDWGDYLRYHYLTLDFSEVREPGQYYLAYGGQRSSIFSIAADVYARNVWQPTLEYFLPVQMCHMRVSDGVRVWHGLCHVDDALMAPTNHNHFDGYAQGPSTLSRFKSGEHVPGLDRGGWHDAGDYDLRVESQADTVHGLALAWELFHPTLDNTTVDQEQRLVYIHQPDGKPDILQQIEHGVLSIVGGYNALGRTYRGIQSSSLHGYMLLGDVANETDNQVFHDADGTAMNTLANWALSGSSAVPKTGAVPSLGLVGAADDRWVFTDNYVPWRDSKIPGALAASYRALSGFNDPLAQECLRIAEELWRDGPEPENSPFRLEAAIELFQATGDRQYADAILKLADVIAADPGQFGWLGARAIPLIHHPAFSVKIRGALRAYRDHLDETARETPYGIPYRPGSGWVPFAGDGWIIERFGVQQFFLHSGAPDIFPDTYMLRAINFVLGCHPGANPSSFVSGVGSRSLIPAFAANRADWSYIPGGIAAGTAMVRPDFLELREWPYSWQQTEYCLGEATADYIFLILAADRTLNPSSARQP